MLGKFKKFLLQQECPQLLLVWEAQLPSCPTFNMVYGISNFRKRGFDCFQKYQWGKEEFLFLYPHSEKISGPMSSKVNVVKFLQYIMT